MHPGPMILSHVVSLDAKLTSQLIIFFSDSFIPYNSIVRIYDIRETPGNTEIGGVEGYWVKALYNNRR